MVKSDLDIFNKKKNRSRSCTEATRLEMSQITNNNPTDLHTPNGQDQKTPYSLTNKPNNYSRTLASLTQNTYLLL